MFAAGPAEQRNRLPQSLAGALNPETMDGRLPEWLFSKPLQPTTQDKGWICHWSLVTGHWVIYWPRLQQMTNDQ
jgi:hypothetical protein